MSEQELKALRVRIDSLDEKVLELISERARCAQEVARVKMASLAEGEVPVFYRPEREAQVLKRVMERNKGPLGNEEMARLFREIMSSCLALEQPLKVAYLGPEGTFTQAAAMKHFGHAVISKPMELLELNKSHAVSPLSAVMQRMPSRPRISASNSRASLSSSTINTRCGGKSGSSITALSASRSASLKISWSDIRFSAVLFNLPAHSSDICGRANNVHFVGKFA